MTTKRLTKWDIATKIMDAQRMAKEYWGIPAWSYTDYYTRAELVDIYNHYITSRGLDLEPII